MNESDLDTENNEQHEMHFEKLNEDLEKIYHEHHRFGQRKMLSTIFMSCIEEALINKVEPEEIKILFHETMEFFMRDFRDRRGIIFHE